MTLDVCGNKLINSLLDDSTSQQELFRAYGISVALEDLVPEVLGFTYVSSNQKYYIVINNNINYEYQQNVLAHELKHIIYDIPKMGYIIGVDMHRTTFEQDADCVGKIIEQYLASYNNTACQMQNSELF